MPQQRCYCDLMDTDLELFSDGYVAFVKEDCPTCLLIEPVLSRFAGSGQLNAIFSQDNKNFPALDITIDDSDLRLSFQHGIETVPSLLKFKDLSLIHISEPTRPY